MGPLTPIPLLWVGSLNRLTHRQSVQGLAQVVPLVRYHQVFGGFGGLPLAWQKTLERVLQRFKFEQKGSTYMGNKLLEHILDFGTAIKPTCDSHFKLLCSQTLHQSLIWILNSSLLWREAHFSFFSSNPFYLEVWQREALGRTETQDFLHVLKNFCFLINLT